MTGVVFFANVYLIPMVIPGLLAYLVEKSNPNLDAQKLTKNKLFLFLLSTRCVTLVMKIYTDNLENKAILWQVLTVVFFILFCALLNLALLVIKLVCNAFMAELDEASDILDIEVLIERYVSLVNKYRGMKQGFSPFLFFFVSFSVVYVLVFSFKIIGLIGAREFLFALGPSAAVFYYLFLIYYLICFCDKSFSALSANNNELRWGELVKGPFTININWWDCYTLHI